MKIESNIRNKKLEFKLEPIGAQLTAALAVAKLCGFMPICTWSWWLITLPWLLPIYIGMTLLVICMIVQAFTGER